MWRDEVGLVEMLFTYINEINKFESYADWRPVLVDILASHEETRKKRNLLAKQFVNENNISKQKSKLQLIEDVKPYEIYDRGSAMDWRTHSSAEPYDYNYASTQNTFDDDGCVDAIKLPTTSRCVQEFDEVIDNIPRQQLRPRFGQKVGGVILIDDENDENENDEIEIVTDCKSDVLIGEIAPVRKVEAIAKKLSANALKKKEASILPETKPAIVGNIVGTMEKPHRCKVCAKHFKRKSHLQNHMRYHYGTRSFHCNLCGKSYYRNSDLNKHKQSHSGERPFPCHLCEKSFPYKSSLKVHIRVVHFDDRPFTCNFCEKAFHQISGLKNHIRSVHKK